MNRQLQGDQRVHSGMTFLQAEHGSKRACERRHDLGTCMDDGRRGSELHRVKRMTDLYINSRLTIPERELGVSTARSSGPGGQNVNKVNSKITLRWNPDQVPMHSTRLGVDAFWPAMAIASIAKEKSYCTASVIVTRGGISRTSDRSWSTMLLECQSPPKARKATRPTKGSQRRRLDEKRRHSEKKEGRRRPSGDSLSAYDQWPLGSIGSACAFACGGIVCLR